MAQLDHILRNRVYAGELNHKGSSYPGEHAAIVTRALFDAVQESLAGRTANRFSGRPPGSTFLSAETAGQARGRDRVWAGQRRQSAGVPPSKILKRREFSALRRNTQFPRNAWWSQAESNRRPPD